MGTYAGDMKQTLIAGKETNAAVPKRERRHPYGMGNQSMSLHQLADFTIG